MKALRRMILPLPLFRKRLAAALRVFSFGMVYPIKIDTVYNLIFEKADFAILYFCSPAQTAALVRLAPNQAHLFCRMQIQ